MQGNIQSGFYGKMPTTGDFISRNLPGAFISFWDQWLQAALESSRRNLGDEWLQYYLVSPLWRFTLSSGICQENVWAGVLMPSVDSVGRYFPMTIAVPLASDSVLLNQCTVHEEWYEKAEKILLDMLSDDDFKLDEFIYNVGMLGVPEQNEGSLYLNGNVETLNHFRYPLENIKGLHSLFTTMLGKHMQVQYSAHSIWWTRGSQDVKPSFMVSEGMPPSGGYSDMITGKWDTGVWQDASLPINT